jgi:hypothetical protein
MKTKLIHKSSYYSAYHHPEAGLIIQTTKGKGGRYMKPTHPQFNDYLQNIINAIDSDEADALCRALYN